MWRHTPLHETLLIYLRPRIVISLLFRPIGMTWFNGLLLWIIYVMRVSFQVLHLLYGKMCAIWPSPQGNLTRNIGKSTLSWRARKAFWSSPQRHTRNDLREMQKLMTTEAAWSWLKQEGRLQLTLLSEYALYHWLRLILTQKAQWHSKLVWLKICTNAYLH